MGATVVAAVGGAGLIAASTATIGAIATAAISTAVAGAVVGGIVSAVTGGNIAEGVLKGAIIGGIAGAAAGVLGIGGTAASSSSTGVSAATSVGASENAAVAATQSAALQQGAGQSTAGLLAGDYTKGMMVKAGVDAVSGMAQGYGKADAAKEQQEFEADQKRVDWNTNASPITGLIKGRTATANMTNPSDQSMSYRFFQGDSLAIETPKIETPKIAPLTLNQHPA